MASNSADERQPLLDDKKEKRRSLLISRSLELELSDSLKRTPDSSANGSGGSAGETPEGSGKVRLQRHITLPYAVFIIVGNVIGSGIFVSPKGVAQNMGSVGGSLLIWAATGLYNLAQALCYAELGAVIPRAGGDYSFIYYILGPLPAFLCGWVHVAIIASSSCAAIARTGALYLLQPLDKDCSVSLITLIAVFFIVTLATINCFSSRWGTRVHTVFSISKLISLTIIIVTGIVQLARGKVGNFENAFEGTTENTGNIALAVLDGYFAYKGWELVMALPEEMVNPKRDLPIAVWIAMILVTAVYTFTNAAYFSVLSVSEVVQSDAVALTFAEKTLGDAKVLIPIAVTLSCLGTVNGDFLSNSRYLFAAGRYKQLPRMFSMINITFLTPLLAIATLAFLALLYTSITDLQVLQEYSSLTVQIKTLLVLTALFYLRWKRPDIERPVKVNIVVAIVTLLLVLLLIGLSFWKSPVTIGIGIGLFAFGVPLYFLGNLGLRSTIVNSAMDKITLGLQIILNIVPETDLEDEEEFFIDEKHD